MRLTRQIAIAVVLLAGTTSSSTTGVLTGIVRDALTGQPLIGATVIVDGTELGNATDVKGHYSVSPIPETTWTATASYMSYIDAKSRFRVLEGRTTRLDFSLFVSYTIKPGVPLTDSALSLFHLRTDSGTIRNDTLICSLGSDDSTLGRCNAARRALLEHFHRGKDLWTALAIEPAYVRLMRWLAVGPGFCYYKEWREWPSGTRQRGRSPPIYKVESLTPGYFTETESGGLRFVECQGRCPNGRLLFLKLALAGGGVAFF